MTMKGNYAARSHLSTKFVILQIHKMRTFKYLNPVSLI